MCKKSVVHFYDLSQNDFNFQSFLTRNCQYINWKLCFALVALLPTVITVNGHQRNTNGDGQYLRLMIREMKQILQEPGCSLLLSESIPVNLTYSTDSPKHLSTFFAWNFLIDHADKNLSIASFYWSLIAEAQFNRSGIEQGRHIFRRLLSKAKYINLKIAQSGSKKPDIELDELTKAGAHVYWVDVTRLLNCGILHTKLWTVDGKHAYIGSANMDWRSLTQVKELGALILNCPIMVADLDKIQKVYQLVAGKASVPSDWPASLTTIYNQTNPMKLRLNGVPSRVYFSSSPKPFNPPGRTNDIDAILGTISSARKFIYISVMNYSPELVNYEQRNLTRFWPVIDDALRAASLDRGVEIRLLISRWKYTASSMKRYLESLRELSGIRGANIRVRYFIVPSFTPDQKIIPHARVNHNKYMVTDKTAYIGTSNWSGEYFCCTGGAAIVIEEIGNCSSEKIGDACPTQPKTIREKLVDIFHRDWNSEYAFEQ